MAQQQADPGPRGLTLQVDGGYAFTGEAKFDRIDGANRSIGTGAFPMFGDIGTGGSISASVGYTIGTYAPTDLANETVDPRAIVGCGLQISGPRPEGMVEVGAPDTYDECHPLIVQAEANGLAGRPDVVLYVTGGWELARHDYEGATVGPGDAAWARYLRGLLELRVASLTSTGAVVALWADTCGPFSEHRVDQRWYRDDVLAPVADEHDDVVLLDPDAPLCGPNGEPLVDIAGVGNPRSDGAHFTEAGAAWFWHAFLADALREAAAGG